MDLNQVICACEAIIEEDILMKVDSILTEKIKNFHKLPLPIPEPVNPLPCKLCNKIGNYCCTNCKVWLCNPCLIK